MDLDADGHDDVISGSYWPGNLTVFPGLGEGRFAKGHELLDAAEKPVNAGGEWKSEEEPDLESLAAAPFAFDWDADGDLDLLIGNIRGHVVLIENEGTAQAARFAPVRRTRLEAAGEAIEVPAGDAGPCVADWDGDGRPDLIVGCGDGSVRLYPGTGERGEPSLGKERILIPPFRGSASPEGDPERSGKRAKVCAADYDGDGRLDLLVGDFWSVQLPAPELSPEESARRDELQAERQRLMEEYRKKLEQLGPDARAARNAAEEDEAVQSLLQRMGDVQRELAPLNGENAYHGWVWLYRRKPAAESAGAGQ